VSGPTILAIDLSAAGGGAALLRGGSTASETFPGSLPRGRDLLPAVRSLLEAASLAPGDLDAVACGVGPGSFTGIRIAVATAATLAYAAGRPALALPSFQGIAENAPVSASHVLVAVEGRRGALVSTLFRREGDRLRPAGELRAASAEETARDLPPGTFLLGEALGRRRHLFPGLPWDPHAPPRPDAIARLGAIAYLAGDRPDPRALRPLYARPPEPEALRAERGGAR